MWFVLRNLSVVTMAFIMVALVTIIFAFVIFKKIQAYFPLPTDAELRVKYLEQYIVLIQLIAVGVAVTLIGIIIPHIFSEARDRFERYKESRVAYSRAKTAVLYLADRVVNVDRNKAFLLVAETHRELHFAETFEDVIIRKGYLKWFDNPYFWISYNYWQIVAVAEVLRIHNWNATKSNDRLKNNIYSMLEVVYKHFGKNGKKCVGRLKSEFEDEVDKKIDEKLKLLKKEEFPT